MPGKRCEMKKQYRSRKLASFGAHAAQRNHDVPFYVYKCRHCHYFHLTTQAR